MADGPPEQFGAYSECQPDRVAVSRTPIPSGQLNALSTSDGLPRLPGAVAR